MGVVHLLWRRAPLVPPQAGRVNVFEGWSIQSAMKKLTVVALIAATVLLTIPVETEAARVRVRKGPRGRVHVTVRPGFPIRRTLPTVVVRPAPVVRVAPRVYLGAVAFTAVAIASLPPADARVWTAAETL